ncbi:MAG: hypothetical protein WCO19_02175 [Candidatus Saccharibacteria bacterium]|nr:hypothetical protein [Candidatus Saccharibacteria bacterium]
MNTDVKNILPLIFKALAWLRHHSVVISITVVAILYAALVVQINILNRKQPSDTSINEKVQTIKQLKIDQSTANKLKKLENNSSEVKTLFKDARENPFQE